VPAGRREVQQAHVLALDRTEVADPSADLDEASLDDAQGLGVVFGLDGTGGSPRNQYRSMLEQQLRKQYERMSKLLATSKLAKNIPGAQLEIIEGAAHIPTAEAAHG
jgi:hypothetical protein